MNYLINKYTPTSLDEMIDNKDNVEKLDLWLSNINNEEHKNAVLISGISGIGKTLLAKLFLKKHGYTVCCFNACDVRSKKSISESLEKLLNQYKINTDPSKQKKIGVIMDELDGMGVGDRGWLPKLSKFINPNRGIRGTKSFVQSVNNTVPLICINNNIYGKKINFLRKDCDDVYVDRIDNETLHKYFMNIVIQEKIKLTEQQLVKIVDDCNSDIRRIFFILQDILNQKTTITDDNLDKLLLDYQKKNYDLSIYDSTNYIINCECTENKEKRIIDLFENDRCLLPQMVHENYISNILSRKNEKHKLNSVYKITKSLYLCDFIDKYIYTNQNWDLQKIQPFFGAVFPNYYLNQCGETTKSNEILFSKCLGKTSSQYTNYKNFEKLTFELYNKIYDYDDINLIFKQIYYQIELDTPESIAKGKKLAQIYNVNFKSLEKMSKFSKLRPKPEIPKIRKIFTVVKPSKTIDTIPAI